MEGPIDSTSLEKLSHRFDRAQKFTLLDSERADRELYRSPIPQQDQRLEHGEGILASGNRHCHAIAIADHLETRYGVADLAQEFFFEVQVLV